MGVGVMVGLGRPPREKMCRWGGWGRLDGALHPGREGGAGPALARGSVSAASGLAMLPRAGRGSREGPRV